ncbi:hypothetical protein CORC01_13564 [Colletotrichum orchidophilum]|uniref:Azaphilone pigments biosynthesis cluster protein L N-terminal domain-containing protein n=1 Tax=Colletotrichum orchidophilum TaxID=1209926 RepID=A0A1G4APZ3_9PEZI|nr:uncharacterized protein CORC01_13564 [Colletotrichum orchidophilum]OHE91153.1 hypothetical protein CORC01_13564 [Colletotrichum orchidophilum]
MDPLSVTASVITLIEASGILTKSLYGFIHGLKTVDTRVTRLCEELTNLTDLLEAVERTLKECRSFDLADVEDDLWQQSNIALADCQATLNDLKMLLAKVKKAAGTRTFGWKFRALFDLTVHGNELVAFQEKIHKSNGALQTILHTITVSLSLKNKISQTLIMDELSRLRLSIDRALEISAKPSEVIAHTFSHRSNARLSRNLQALAEAAKNFYSTASSTAGTSRGDRSERTWQPLSPTGISLTSNLSPFRRERVERFIVEGQTQSTPLVPQLLPQVDTSVRNQPPGLDSCASPVKSESSDLPAPEDDSDLEYLEVDDDEDEEAAFSRDYILCIRQIAIENIKSRDFVKAADMLTKALASYEKATLDEGDFCQSSYISMRSLKVQLAICYFFQGNWKMAEPVVTDLASSKSGRDSVVCNLLHALALAYLSEYFFDIALDTCKQAVRGHARLSKLRKTDIITLDLNNSLGLLATTYDMTGDYLRAEVFRRRLSQGFKYQHPANVTDFLENHSDFLSAALGPYTLDPACVVLPDSPVGQPNEQDAGAYSPSGQEVFQLRWDGCGTISHLPSPLQLSMVKHQRLDIDTRKEVITPARPSVIEDDTVEESSPTETIGTSPGTMASPVTTSDGSPVYGRLTRAFSRFGLNQSVARAESGFSSAPELSLPCDSCQHSTRVTRQSTRMSQKTPSAAKPKLSIKLPAARQTERWPWVKSWRMSSSPDGVLDERLRPSKLNRRSATRSPGKRSPISEWFTPAKWFRGGQIISSSPTTSLKAEAASHTWVRHGPYRPEEVFHELNDSSISELGITSPTPELAEDRPSPTSARSQRVRFYIPQPVNRSSIMAGTERYELPPDSFMSGALAGL